MMNPDKLNKQLHKQVKMMRKELKQTRRAMKNMGSEMSGMNAPEAPQNERSVGGMMKTLLFGTGEAMPEIDPASIPRDHIMDPKSFSKEAVMAGAGRGEDVLPPENELFDADLMFATQLQQIEKGRVRQAPPFIGDACFDVEDQAGLQRWQETHKKRQKDIKNKHLDQILTPEPVSVLAMEGGFSSVLLEMLKEEENCYGMLGYGPEYHHMNLDDIDATLTNALNESERLVAIGPIGLDMVQEDAYSLESQKALLVRQLDVAVDFAVPVVLRQHGAGDALREVIDQFARKDELIGIWMSPLTTPAGFEWLTQNDFYLGITPAFTHLKYESFRQFLKEFTTDKIILASGDMGTAPENRFGDWNTPWMWEDTFEVLVGAEVLNKQEPEERHELMHQLNANFIRAFFGESDSETE